MNGADGIGVVTHRLSLLSGLQPFAAPYFMPIWFIAKSGEREQTLVRYLFTSADEPDALPLRGAFTIGAGNL